LFSRETVVDALVHARRLTPFLATRVLSGTLSGLRFGGYRVLDRLSSGSLGVVFRGEHLELGQPVAIKALPLDPQLHPTAVDRFFTEVRILAKLDHPCVPKIYDAGRVAATQPGLPGYAYLVMELVAGGDLENFVYQNGLPTVTQACQWGQQAALGLQACHAAGFIHRDVKPSNLLLDEAQQLKLTDFGLAREFGSTRTAPQSLLGSVEFLAPEQLADASTVGESADVYSLGCTLFWLLSGQLPHPQQSTTALAMELIRQGTPRRLRSVAPEAPAPLDELLAKMLAHSPADRPRMATVAQSLTQFLEAEHVTPPHPACPHHDPLLKTLARQLDDLRAAVWHPWCLALQRHPVEGGEHPQRVAGYANLIATTLSRQADWILFSDRRAVIELTQACLLHDLGWLLMPGLLAEPAPEAGDAAHAAHAAHTQLGTALLQDLAQSYPDHFPGWRTTLAVVRHHHERWDGKGYPDRLKAGEIPAAARIAAVAIGYDDQRRQGHTHQEAVEQLRGDAGYRYDPAVVAAWLEIASSCQTLYDRSVGLRPEVTLPEQAASPGT